MNFEQDELVFISSFWLNEFKQPITSPSFEYNGRKYFEFICHGVNFVVVQHDTSVIYEIYQVIDKDQVTWVSVRKDTVIVEAKRTLVQKVN